MFTPSLYGFALMIRPTSWLALLSRRFTFELLLTGSPKANVEYNYLDKPKADTHQTHSRPPPTVAFSIVTRNRSMT
jgi:hypothetical protein